MTENEAIEFLHDLLSITDYKMKHKEAVELAESAIEKQSMVNEILSELKQYSAIGTVEEVKYLIGSYNDMIHDFGDDMVALEQYRAIGTIEECRTAVERMKPKKPIYKFKYEDGRKFHDCPVCGSYVTHALEQDQVKYCNCCGQKLDWN